MKLSIRYYPDPILREKAKEIKKITDEIKALAMNMVETMDALRGVGLSANQVGSLYKILVLRPEIKSENNEITLGEPEFYINPILSNPSKEMESMVEGCLSFPKLHLEIIRPISIHIEAINLKEEKISKDVKGFQARVLMHENDHLNATLFIDRVSKKDRQAIEEKLRDLKKMYKKNKLR